MRFSAIFQLPITPREPAGEDASRREPPAEALPPAPLPQDLPDDLDARVRLVGEWQLFES